MKLLKKNSRRGCTAKTSISATAEEVTEKAVATKADAMVTVTGAAVMARAITRADAAMRVKDMEKDAAMTARGTRRAAADMVKDITKAAAATGKRINSRDVAFTRVCICSAFRRI